MFFSYPWMLWGLVVTVLPWVLRRRQPDKIEEVPFGLFSFLLASEPRRWLSRRAQEILLLIVRTLLLTALVLALAGPRWVPSGQTAQPESERQERILLLDRTPSLGDPDVGASAAAKSLEAARKLLALSRHSAAWDVWGWRGDLPPSQKIVQTDPTRERSQLDARMSALEERTLSGPLSQAIRALTGDDPHPAPILFLTDRQRATWEPWLDPASRLSLPGSLEFHAMALSSPVTPTPWISLIGGSTQPWGAGTDAEVVIRVHEPAGGGATPLQLRVVSGRTAEAPLLDTELEPTTDIPEDRVATRDERLLVPVDAVTEAVPGSPGRNQARLDVEILRNGKRIDRQRLITPVVSSRRAGLMVTESLLPAVAVALRPSREGTPFFHPVPAGETLGGEPGKTELTEPPLIVVQGEQARRVPLLFDRCLQAVEGGGSMLLTVTGEETTQDVSAPGATRLNAFLDGPLGWSWTTSEATSGVSNWTWHASDGMTQIMSPWAENLWAAAQPQTLAGRTQKGRVLLSRSGDGSAPDEHFFSRHEVGRGRVIVARLDLHEGVRLPEFAPWLIETLKDLIRSSKGWKPPPSWTGVRWEPDPRPITQIDMKRLAQKGIRIETLQNADDVLDRWSGQPRSLVVWLLGGALLLAFLELLIGNSAA